ncbi:maleylpyruvate isomerase family mycothiol-dependent enzyme [Mycobacterium sp. D16Q16]|uniref:maleylpyruvate isomerase family mycothiol-dependent enzyme n=1 Tax=Mycobacterium sp. D16Q16 TaxID=1855659 RepID=UPI00099217CD|nr:maleylpyruvate isomerase family mycothiol-dependent enzyme [Mycobacterium sp. D16Q16]
MTVTIVAKDPVVAALGAEWAALDELGAALTDEQWAASSVLPGWTVKDVIAHVVSTERLLSGDPIPSTDEAVAALPHVHNPVGVLNERWLTYYRKLPPGAVLNDLRTVTSARLAVLEGLSQDQFNAETVTPVGPESHGRFMQIRDFDCWMHELDVRDSLGLPAPADPVAATPALTELINALPFLIGKRAGAPQGSRVRFVLTGIGAQKVDIEIPDRARIVSALSGTPHVTLTADTSEFARHLGGRASANRNGFTLDGDPDLGWKIIPNLRFTM